MSHVVRNRAKLLARTRRIGGQLSTIERALTDGVECVAVLTQIAAVRGAVQGLLLEVLSDHLDEHVAGQGRRSQREKELAKVIALFSAFMK